MRLLVNTPDGRQEIIEVGPGGGYFDSERVLWDERIDGDLPPVTLGGMRRDGDALVFDASMVAAGSPYFSRVLADRLAECDALAKSKRDAVVAGISSAEMASWPIKRAEALAYQAAGQSASEADAPNLAAEAGSRSITLAALVGKVIAKANFLAGLEAQIAGVCGRHQDVIRGLATLDALEAYDIATGWPV